MTNLTEKWKKGELPNGWYYVRLIRGEHRIDLYINDKNEWIDCPDDIIDTVVCEVPSYEEWQKHRKTLLKTQEKNCDLEIKNKQLKDLLKECKLAIFDYPPYDLASDKIRLQIKINQVLGEE